MSTVPPDEVEGALPAEQLNADQDRTPAQAEARPRRLRGEKAERILKRCKENFKRWLEFEGVFLARYNEDIRFTHGDSDNLWQWEQELVNDRADKPTLTANMVRINCNLVTNAIRRAPPSIAIKPAGMGATGGSAKVVGGLIREISRESNAVGIYVAQGESAVQGGVGYWRVITEYESPSSFDQVIRIRNVADATKAGIDYNVKEPDGSDANWGFIYEDLPNEEVAEEYPDDEEELGTTNEVITTWGESSWVFTKHTRVCEWYERERYRDELIEFAGEGGQMVRQFRSKIPRDLLQPILLDPMTRRRDVLRCRIMWYKIVGDSIVDHHEVPGELIPIVRVTGEQVVVEGELDRKGLTRNLKDPQRNMNFWISSAAEQVALQTKVPYIGPKKAFENNPQWNDANTSNYAYLPYNHYDDENKQTIPAPTRPQQPQLADAYIKGLQLAEGLLRDIAGQRTPGQITDNQQDESGRALLIRKASGEIATYNYPDALAAGVAYTGRIILGMLPVVYDTERMIQITNPDNTQSSVQINPSMPEAHVESPGEEEGSKNVELNPSVGIYNVEASSGPDYETQRQWAVEAMGTVLGGNKDLWPVVGDLFVQNMDFPGADEMAERIRRTINPAILGEGPTQNEQKLNAQIQQMQKLLESLVQSLAEKQGKLEDKDEETTIKAYDAETNRLKQIGNSQENYEEGGMGETWRAIAGKTASDVANDPDPTQSAEAKDAENDPPVEGAEMGEDGGWYVNHPTAGRMKYEPEAGQ